MLGGIESRWRSRTTQIDGSDHRAEKGRGCNLAAGDRLRLLFAYSVRQ